MHTSQYFLLVLVVVIMFSICHKFLYDSLKAVVVFLTQTYHHTVGKDLQAPLKKNKNPEMGGACKSFLNKKPVVA